MAVFQYQSNDTSHPELSIEGRNRRTLDNKWSLVIFQKINQINYES